jgi:hypothetical protein
MGQSADSKKFWLSKTFWMNVLAIIFIVVASLTGWEAPAPVMVTALGVINILLRSITKTEISWTNDIDLSSK